MTATIIPFLGSAFFDPAHVEPRSSPFRSYPKAAIGHTIVRWHLK